MKTNVFYVDVLETDFVINLLDLNTLQITQLRNDDDICAVIKESDLFIGFGDEQLTLLKAALKDMSLNRINEGLKAGLKEYQISRILTTVNLNFYNVNINKKYSLRNETLKLGLAENSNKLIQILEILNDNIDDFKAQIEIIKEFNLDLKNLKMTKQQIAAEVLEARETPFDKTDVFNYIKCNNIILKRYKAVEDFFETIDEENNSFEIEIKGLKHNYGLGGLHAGEKYNGEGFFASLDVESMYPSIMCNYNLISRACKDVDKYKSLLKKRLIYKHNKDAIERPYKIVLNSTFGAANYKYSKLYDPKMANNTCIYGQLLLTDLIETLENELTYELLQTNTDGIFIKIDKKDKEKMIGIVTEWEKRTGLKISYEYFKKIWQKDVNNYCLLKNDGSVKRKGNFFKDGNNNNQIIRDALVNYLLFNKRIEDTINNETQAIKFQNVINVGESYDFVFLNDEKIDKDFRVFLGYSKNEIRKQKTGGNKERIADVTDYCFIYNDSLKELDITLINKNKYIEITKDRLKQLI